MSDVDLVENMREMIHELERFAPRDEWFPHQHYFAAAADRIEALEAERDRLRNAMVVMDNTVRELTEAMKGPLSWLERWAVHVGSCGRKSYCECGLHMAQHELRAALEASNGAD